MAGCQHSGGDSTLPRLRLSPVANAAILNSHVITACSGCTWTHAHGFTRGEQANSGFGTSRGSGAAFRKRAGVSIRDY
jgi:hypothetical protein